MADTYNRDKLREQNDLSEEIVQAITGNQLGEPVDDMELEDELEAMQQEHLDEQMLKTGNVPTTDAVANKMPSPAQQERKCPTQSAGMWEVTHTLTRNSCTSQETGSGGRRRGRTGEATSRDGHVGPGMHGTKHSGLQLRPLIRFTGPGITRW